MITYTCMKIRIKLKQGKRIKNRNEKQKQKRLVQYKYWVKYHIVIVDIS